MKEQAIQKLKHELKTLSSSKDNREEELGHTFVKEQLSNAQSYIQQLEKANSELTIEHSQIQDQLSQSNRQVEELLSPGKGEETREMKGRSGGKSPFRGSSIAEISEFKSPKSSVKTPSKQLFPSRKAV